METGTEEQMQEQNAADATKEPLLPPIESLESQISEINGIKVLFD